MRQINAVEGVQEFEGKHDARRCPLANCPDCATVFTQVQRLAAYWVWEADDMGAGPDFYYAMNSLEAVLKGDDSPSIPDIEERV